ncbi:MAG: polysaccharide pyruvyl transferase family protein [Bacillota bacterium]|nr:polysaccharide pyruvyl transferase family protein [Bacillota bacterium]
MIYIIAYFNKNFGDDLFVRTLVRRYPNEIFYVSERKKRIGDLSNEKNLKYNTFIRSIVLKIKKMVCKDESGLINNKKVKKAKALVRIGGSIFMEMPGWQDRKIRYDNKNVFYIGANFGPYTTLEYKEDVKDRIKQSISCCFRDKYSYKEFSDLNNVHYAPDVLFGYPYLPEYKKGETIGISVIDFMGKSNLREYCEQYEDGIVSLCNHYTSLGKKVSLLGFCEPEGDMNAVNRIMERIEKKELVSSICYDGEIDKFLDILNDCEIIFATRFHAMILGFIMNKKVLPIIYSKKQTHVLEDMCFQGIIWNILDGDNFSEELFNVDMNKVDDGTLSKLIAESEKQFYHLDVFLGK